MLKRDLRNRLGGENNLVDDAQKTHVLFDNFVEQVGAGIALTDETGRILVWNPAMEKVSGLQASQVVGRWAWEVHFELLPPEVRQSTSLETLEQKFTAILSAGFPAGARTGGQSFFQHGIFKAAPAGVVYAIETERGYCLLNILYQTELLPGQDQALLASEEKFRNVVEQAGDGIILLDAQENILEWNEGCEQISGIERERALGLRLTDLIPELFQGAEWAVSRPGLSLHDQILRYLSLVARTGLPRVIDGVLHHRNGSRQWLQVVTFPIQASGVQLFGMIAHDVTVLKRSEAWLQHYNHQLETLRQAGLEISAELGLDALVWMIAPRAVELLNGTAVALYLHNPDKDVLELAISLGDNQPNLEKQVQRGDGLAGRVWESGKPVLLEDFHTGRTADLSKSYWGKVAGAPLIWGNEFMGVVFVFSDQKFFENDLKILELFSSHAAAATRNARLHHQLSQLAVTDSLTGIYNRRHFFEMAEKEFHQAMRYKRPFSVVMFDLDLFKKINDSFGHARGDEILQMVVKRCATQMREADVLGRYGGEEFVIALPETGAEEALALAERLRQELASRVIESEAVPVLVTASFGVAALTERITDLMQLLNRADAALYWAKQAGRNRAVLWQADFHQETAPSEP